MNEANRQITLFNGTTVSCDGYTVLLTAALTNPNSTIVADLRIVLGARDFHALIAFAREQGLLDG